jgi:hypothetical protein
MDCLRSFIQTTNLSTTLQSLNAVSQFWGSAPNYHCSSIASFTNVGGPVIFEPQGFKNIDVYGLKILGQIQCNWASATLQGQILDFGFNINLVGTYPLIGANVSNNILPIVQNPTTISLTKYQPDIFFKSPIKSIDNISVQNLLIAANNCVSNTNLSLAGSISMIVYYKFEGE